MSKENRSSYSTKSPDSKAMISFQQPDGTWVNVSKGDYPAARAAFVNFWLMWGNHMRSNKSELKFGDHLK